MQALTIRRSQGKGFDIVYLLSVEDGVDWEWPWSQGKRLVNVAVSRAKQELRVLVSTQLMSEGRRNDLARTPGTEAMPCRNDDPQNRELYIRKLVDYVAENAPVDLDGPFGLVESGIRSVFDRVPVDRSHMREDDKGWKRGRPHDWATECASRRALRDVLRGLPGTSRLQLYAQVRLCDLVLRDTDDERDGKTLASLAGDRYVSPDKTHFDFVLCDGDRVLLAVEVDGGFHRYGECDGAGQEADDDLAFKKVVQSLGLTVPKASSHPKPDGHVMRYDFAKDRLVVETCDGVVAHLGKDSTLGMQREYLASVRRGCLAAETDDQPRPTTLLGEDDDPFADDVATPDALADGCGLVPLRIPTDGSTCYETRALREQAVRDGVALPDDLPPAIDDYVERCLALAAAAPGPA